MQNQYPVWYFFYGTLANTEVLSRQLSLPEDKISLLAPAIISGGVIKTWASKYKALVDGSSSCLVKGSAFQVMSREQEDALRSYETDNYEVVRCEISTGGSAVPGCTFRFVGKIDK